MLFHGLPAFFLLHSTSEDHRTLDTLGAIDCHLRLVGELKVASQHDLTFYLAGVPLVTVNVPKVLDLLDPPPEDGEAFCARFMERAGALWAGAH